MPEELPLFPDTAAGVPLEDDIARLACRYYEEEGTQTGARKNAATAAIAFCLPVKAFSPFPLVMLVVALATAPVFALGQSLSGRASSTNQVIATTPGKTPPKPQAVVTPQPNQFVPVLPGEIVAPLPHELTRPLPRQIVRSLPGQMTRSLPGHIVRSLPGQIVQPLPGQIVR